MSRLHPPVLSETTRPACAESSTDRQNLSSNLPGEDHLSSVLAGETLTVEPWQVEHGDRLLGLHSIIDSILCDGTWWYYGDQHGRIIAKRRCDSRVQIIRDSSASETDDSGGSSAVTAFPSATSHIDDCPPHGIPRSGVITFPRTGRKVMMP